MHLELPPPRRKRLVSMTPLIDVVFILLLFFMLVSNFQQWRTMPLNLAGQNSGPAALEPMFSVHIGRAGTLMLNETPVAPAELTAILTKQIAPGANPRVLVETDESTDLQTLVQVIDSISATGIDRITLGKASP